jgi:hypothetical protein
MTNASDLIAQAQLAVAQFDRMIDTVSPRKGTSPELSQVLDDLADKRSQILTSIGAPVKAGSVDAMTFSLAALKLATGNLRGIAESMTGPADVLSTAAAFLGHGGSALRAIATFSITGKICSNPHSPHEQDYPYPRRCLQCGFAVP